MTDCIDLRTFGDRYRVFNELEGRKAHERDCPWDLVIPGVSGFVCPWGAATLAACTRRRVTTNRILAVVPGAVVVQDGADGQNVRFPAEHFQAVAEILGLRKRRQMTDQQKRELAERVKPYAWPPGVQGGRQQAIQATEEAVPATPGAAGGPGAT